MDEIRKMLHSHPDVSGGEKYAHNLVVEELTRLAPDRLHTHVGGYGVVAFFGKSASEPTLAFRADIDALPIGHRCGHDGHTVTLLRFAQLVNAQRAELPYNVLLIFQPEEETGAGARKIVESGILDEYNIKYIFGYHNIPGYSEGEVLLNSRTFAAASSGVVYSLHGRPTHASTPEKGLGPGLAVAEIIESMQQRMNHPVESGDQSSFMQSTLICVRVGEEAFGTAAGDATLMFTLRAFTNATMARLLDQASDMVASVATRYGLTVGSSQVEPFMATENNADVVSSIAVIAHEGGYAVRELNQPFRWSEDFATYLQKYPGALFGVGAGIDHVELHHPDYDFPDAIVEPTAQLFLRLAMNKWK